MLKWWDVWTRNNLFQAFKILKFKLKYYMNINTSSRIVVDTLI